jgi:hypothetical protein
MKAIRKTAAEELGASSSLSLRASLFKHPGSIYFSEGKQSSPILTYTKNITIHKFILMTLN